VGVGKKDRVHSADLVFKSLVTEVRSGIDQDHPAVVERKAGGRSVAMIAGMTRRAHLARTSRERNSRRGACAEEGELHRETIHA
jgi:hypothetical protein